MSIIPSIQVLVSTMNQQDYSLLDKMNIQSDAIVINQANRDGLEIFEYKGHWIKWINMSQRGIGISRNTALMNSSADIILFADDDIEYVDRYVENVVNAFADYSSADVICFNINLVNSSKNIGGHRNNTKNKKLHFYNSMRYGATLIAARRKILWRERIYFSLLFGGGAEFSSGEDSLFIKDCHNSKLQVYSNVFCLGNVDDSKSSWYKGIDDKFFEDRGRVYASAFPKIHWMVFVYYSYKLSKVYREYGFMRIFSLFNRGKKLIKVYR